METLFGFFIFKFILKLYFLNSDARCCFFLEIRTNQMFKSMNCRNGFSADIQVKMFVT